MEQKRRPAVVVTAAALIFLAASFPHPSSAGSNCSSATVQPYGAARLLSSVVDTATAEQSQRRHLEALFDR